MRCFEKTWGLSILPWVSCAFSDECFPCLSPFNEAWTALSQVSWFCLWGFVDHALDKIWITSLWWYLYGNSWQSGALVVSMILLGFLLVISLGSSHAATCCGNFENCFYLCPGACFNDDPIAFVWWVVFLRNVKWPTLTLLFWWPINFFFFDLCHLSNMYCSNSRFYNSRLTSL